LADTVTINVIGVGITGDVVIATEEMSAESEKSILTVRVLRLAACDRDETLMPSEITIVHFVFEPSTEDAVTKFIVAVAVPEFVAEAVNDVEPHPSTDGTAKEPIENCGSTRAIESPILSGALRVNEKDIDDTAYAAGFAIVNMLPVI